jgi:uncharacterized cupredoxin-like copper-binding protein
MFTPKTILALVSVSGVLAGCGGSDTTTDSKSPATTTTTAPATESTPSVTTPLRVVMSDFAFAPKAATVAAGSITLTAPNTGKAPHELVLVKFAGDPQKLPAKPDGSADEGAISPASLPGEVEQTAPGATGRLTVTLPAGRYVMLCNVPGHYKAGMYGTLTVT